MSINLDYYSTLKELRSFSGRRDVNLELVRVKKGTHFVPHAKMDKLGRRTIVLEQPEADWPKRRVKMFRGLFHHEIGHFDPAVADDYVLLDKYKINPESFYFGGINCFSDYRQEKNRLGEFLGRDDDLAHLNKYAIEDIINNVGYKWRTLDADSDAGIMAALLTYNAKAREAWQLPVIGIHDALRNILPDAVNANVDKLIDGGYIGKLDACKKAEDLKDLWDDMLVNVFNRNAEEELNEATRRSAGESAGENGEGQHDSGSDEGTTGGKDGEDSAKEGRSREASEKETIPRTVRWQDIVPNKHDTAEAPSYTPMKISYDGYDQDEFFPVAEKLDVRDYVNKTGDISANPRSRYMDKTSHINVHTGLSNKIRKLLQVKTQKLTVYGQKKGKLANKNIHRAALDNAGEYSQRVFKKKEQKYDLDVAVSVALDFSGSMGGDKMVHGIASALMLNEAVSKIGVPIEILGFTEIRDKSIISILKTFNKPISNEELRVNMCKATNTMSQNADGEAILYAYNRLMRQKTKRKLLIVLSDGQPASDRGMCYTFTKDVIADIHKAKHAEIYGIGIEDDTVQELYPNWTVIKHDSELESAVLNVVKNRILK